MTVLAFMTVAVLSACGASPTADTATTPEEPAAPPTVTVALRFVEGPEDDARGTPSTRVLLVDIDPAHGRRTTDLGTYPGVCSHLSPGPGVLLRAQCFWAGEASRLAVARDGDALVVTRTVLDEAGREAGDNVVVRADLPPGAAVEVLAPATRLGAD